MSEDVNARILVTVEAAAAKQGINEVKSGLKGITDARMLDLQVEQARVKNENAEFQSQIAAQKAYRAELQLVAAEKKKADMTQRGADSFDIRRQEEKISKLRGQTLKYQQESAEADTKALNARKEYMHLMAKSSLVQQSDGPLISSTAESVKKLSFATKNMMVNDQKSVAEKIKLRLATKMLKTEMGEGSAGMRKAGIAIFAMSAAVKIAKTAYDLLTFSVRENVTIAKRNLASIRETREAFNEKVSRQTESLDVIGELTQKEELNAVESFRLSRAVRALGGDFAALADNINGSATSMADLEEAEITYRERIHRQKIEQAEIELRGIDATLSALRARLETVQDGPQGLLPGFIQAAAVIEKEIGDLITQQGKVSRELAALRSQDVGGDLRRERAARRADRAWQTQQRIDDLLIQRGGFALGERERFFYGWSNDRQIREAYRRAQEATLPEIARNIRFYEQQILNIQMQKGRDLPSARSDDEREYLEQVFATAEQQARESLNYWKNKIGNLTSTIIAGLTDILPHEARLRLEERENAFARQIASVTAENRRYRLQLEEATDSINLWQRQFLDKDLSGLQVGIIEIQNKYRSEFRSLAQEINSYRSFLVTEVDPANKRYLENMISLLQERRDMLRDQQSQEIRLLRLQHENQERLSAQRKSVELRYQIEDIERETRYADWEASGQRERAARARINLALDRTARGLQGAELAEFNYSRQRLFDAQMAQWRANEARSERERQREQERRQREQAEQERERTVSARRGAYDSISGELMKFAETAQNAVTSTSLEGLRLQSRIFMNTGVSLTDNPAKQSAASLKVIQVKLTAMEGRLNEVTAALSAINGNTRSLNGMKFHAY